MNGELEKLTTQELVSLETMVSIICRRYENIAEMNRFSSSDIDDKQYIKASNNLTYFNRKRDRIIDEMEKRVNKLITE